MLAMYIRDMRHRASTRRSLVMLLFIGLGVSSGTCNAQISRASACHTSTVADAWGPSFAAEAKQFFLEVQAAVRADDKGAFAALIQYPLHVHEGNGGYEIPNRAEMIRKYPLIFTADSKRAILLQTPECLFGNGQGVMAAGGRIWFQKQSDGKMRIITLNIISTR